MRLGWISYIYTLDYIHVAYAKHIKSLQNMLSYNNNNDTTSNIEHSLVSFSALVSGVE